MKMSLGSLLITYMLLGANIIFKGDKEVFTSTGKTKVPYELAKHELSWTGAHGLVTSPFGSKAFT